MWLQITLGVTAVLAVVALVLTQTKWFKVRKYALDLKRVFDRHKGLQEKLEGAQSLSQNPNQVLVKKGLRELVTVYQALIDDLEKMKVPPAAKEIHGETLTMHKESCNLYQVALVGGFRQKALEGKQKRLMAMEKGLQAKMEKIYGPMKKPKK